VTAEYHLSMLRLATETRLAILPAGLVPQIPLY